MDRKETIRIFRQRLLAAMTQAEVNRSQLAERAGIDRSTLSQLLSSDTARLPRADTVAAIARVLRVSLDWLMGLSGEASIGAEIIDESVQVAPHRHGNADINLAHWHQEAVGYKIRYIPSTLPDLMKTEAVLRYEYESFAARTPDQAIAASQGRLAYSKQPDTDIEICVSQQALESFARGESVWRLLPVSERRQQLEQMIQLCEELYPSLRLFLFDGRTSYAAPYTVFGPLRAVIYLGQMYMVFNTTTHVRLLSRHFDDLIRVAVVQCHETGSFLRELLEELPCR